MPQVLETGYLPTLELYNKTRFNTIFQQDNDPKHTAKGVKAWFRKNQIQVMEWPTQSPDLNPIENLWQILKTKVMSFKDECKGINELWERVQLVFDDIDKETCAELVVSLPQCVKVVMTAFGGWTNY